MQRALGLLFILLTVGSASSQDNDVTYSQLLGSMTPAEKAGQMIIVYNTDAEFLREHSVGGIILFQPMVTDSLQLRRELAQKQQAMTIPLLICIDQEGGTVNRLGNLARFAAAPSAVDLTKLPDRLVRSSAAELTAFLLSVGINVNFAPCLDPARSLATGQQTYLATQQRSFGDNPALITRKAGAFLSGVNQAGGLAVVKHFPGYDAPQSSDQRLTVSLASADAVAQYLLPFAELAPSCSGVMMSNIVYSELDSLPAVLSARVVSWARSLFNNGLIVTDDLWAVSVRQVVDPTLTSLRQETVDVKFATLVQMAVLAGNDMLLITYPAKVPIMVEAITQLMEQDQQARQAVDAAVSRILRLKEKL